MLHFSAFGTLGHVNVDTDANINNKITCLGDNRAGKQYAREYIKAWLNLRFIYLSIYLCSITCMHGLTKACLDINVLRIIHCDSVKICNCSEMENESSG